MLTELDDLNMESPDSVAALLSLFLIGLMRLLVFAPNNYLFQDEVRIFRTLRMIFMLEISISGIVNFALADVDKETDVYIDYFQFTNEMCDPSDTLIQFFVSGKFSFLYNAKTLRSIMSILNSNCAYLNSNASNDDVETLWTGLFTGEYTFPYFCGDCGGQLNINQEMLTFSYIDVPLLCGQTSKKNGILGSKIERTVQSLMDMNGCPLHISGNESALNGYFNIRHPSVKNKACKEKSGTYSQTRILKFPKIIILRIKRESSTGGKKTKGAKTPYKVSKSDACVKFPTVFDFGEHFGGLGSGLILYQLEAVINHSGTVDTGIEF